MKRFLLLFSLVVMFSCEDEKDSESSSNSNLLGKWNMTNMGEYENANCSGKIDYSAFALMQAFGVSQVMEFKSNGTMTLTISMLGETDVLSASWAEGKNQFCAEGECIDFTVSGDVLTYNGQSEAYCEDSDGNETSQTSESACTSAGNDWYEASCSVTEFTKQ
tara:strand:+ start:632 stop:1120 length:489 start_codon:yes stop_codon:yes gene_type:complete